MSRNVNQVFQDLATQCRAFVDNCNSFYSEISLHLPDSYQSEIRDLSDRLETALSDFIEDLSAPTLTLATTGTTSSGKSTLVNFLCGAEIVPVAVGEMSAGVVTIEYADETSLTIYETAHATWECGEWKNVTDQDIYDKLYHVMIDYLDRREGNQKIACPRTLIKYPFRILDALHLNLPKGTKVRILDLPGLAYVGDESNAEVIRQCREALCLVTYNSAETDVKRRKNLLQEVVLQVKELGGSPARMLFILNRIDVFRANSDWPQEENRFVDKTTESIKFELSEQLKKYSSIIEDLEIIKLSSWPALLALQIKKNNRHESIEACKKADSQFNFLIDDILEDLPRKHDMWSPHDCDRVADYLWNKAYAPEFEGELSHHISSHFPQLVVPQMIERFRDHAGTAVTEWATHTTSAILKSSEQEYQQECQSIMQIRASLDHFLETSNRKLRQPFEKVNNKFKEILALNPEADSTKIDEPIRYLETVIKSELQSIEPYNLLGDKLYPIYGWKKELSKGINQVLEAVADSLKTGNFVLENSYFQKADPRQLDLLEQNIKTLVNLNYTGDIARHGEERTATTDEDKQELHLLNAALNELAMNLSLVMQDILNQVCSQTGNRIYDSVNELFKFHLSHLEQGSNQIAPSMGISFPESQLIKIGQQPKIHINFEAGFAVTEGIYEDATQVAYRERPWLTLWLVEVTKYKIEYKTRSSDNASIPSVVDLLKSWIYQAKAAEAEVANQIALWFLYQVYLLEKNVKQLQNQIIDRYQQRLDMAYQEITLFHENRQKIWEEISQQAAGLREQFAEFEKSCQGEG